MLLKISSLGKPVLALQNARLAHIKQSNANRQTRTSRASNHMITTVLGDKVAN